MIRPLCRRIIDIVENIDAKIDLPTDYPFDYQLAMDRLRGFRAPRDKLGALCRRGDVVRVKKGLYIPGWRRGQEMPVDPLVLSGLVYGPSYVSLETALSWYGLIPERVEEITCMGLKKAKLFQTPAGRFSYHPVNERVFSFGVRLESTKGGTFFLAEPEKALCDRIALVSELAAVREVAAVIYEDLRIEEEAIRSLRLPVVTEIAARYGRRNVSVFQRWLEKQTRTVTRSA